MGQVKSMLFRTTAGRLSTMVAGPALSSCSPIEVAEGEPGYSELVLGTIYENRTCVGVTWAWFACPVAVMALTLVFLVATIVHSSRYVRPGHRVAGPARGPWKLSTMPLLWYGIEDSTRSQMPEFGEVDDMEKCSDTVRDGQVVHGAQPEEERGNYSGDAFPSTINLGVRKICAIRTLDMNITEQYG
ncbi:hypothetical protein B0T16DRAFT_448124 [Cercophora newfieldiana]|uniref:Uncharacterized protein n=1 Tax=Cercophora newfieldiana TaxID=92897 RepID=A0AA39Y4T0_9PEZI|nr:hypothetical protein B0T16DRAFT_448124 [Cercophora newfieldiana]